MANLNFKKERCYNYRSLLRSIWHRLCLLVEPKDKTRMKIEKVSIIPKSESRQPEMRQPNTMSISWPDTCEHNEREFDEASYYQDHYDEYQDDPEDEISFPPEIFDANDE